jgi:acyl carrier protein
MLEKITEIVRDYKGEEDIEITEETTFASLELDSLEMVELIMKVEDEFDVSIEVNDSIKTVSDLMKLLV